MNAGVQRRFPIDGATVSGSRMFLQSISDPNSVVTAIDSATRFPESLDVLLTKYRAHVETFCQLVSEEPSSAALLERIRSTEFNDKTRVALLKIFRRSVSPVIDTEMARKIQKVPSATIVGNYGHTFKDIGLLKQQFSAMTIDQKATLAVLVGENDNRGQVGYSLTGMFFDWFETKFEGALTIEGPRGAGPDVELSTVLPGFVGGYPCDFVIRNAGTMEVLAIGFARYDATRGGSQSNDRTDGNSYKVSKAREFCERTGDRLRILFLADGPGLTHGDTWRAAVALDGDWSGNVRVTTLKLAEQRVTAEWLTTVASD